MIYLLDSVVNCNSQDILKIVTLVQKLYTILIVAAPLIIIIGGSIDFVQAVIAHKDEDIDKAKHKFLNRIIMGCGVLLLLSVMRLIVNVIAAAGTDSSE